MLDERKAPKINPRHHANFRSSQERGYVFNATLPAETLIGCMQQHSWKLIGLDNGEKNHFQPCSCTNACTVLT